MTNKQKSKPDTVTVHNDKPDTVIVHYDKPDTVIVHYDEIGLKGANRPYFEKLLMKNIERKLSSISGHPGKDKGSTVARKHIRVAGKHIRVAGKHIQIAREHGQIALSIGAGDNLLEIADALSKIPGIAFFSFTKKTGLDIKSIKESSVEFLRKAKFESFKVNSKRHNKNVPFTSMELNALIGEVLIDAFGKKVKMKGADLVLKIEVSNKFSYLSCKDITGVGGLPTDSRQKVVSLMSGGFDSPVASYLMMKRGCEVILVHFQNQNLLSESVENKIVRLAKHLSKYQVKTKLFIVPFGEIQNEIISKVHSGVRMLVYRKFMIEISSTIADKEKAGFLVVGDSLSQVASQTFENLNAVYSGSEKHIFSPLIGLNKQEIIDIAKEIGTYDISALPYGDCCSYFVPKHPELRAGKETLEKCKEAIESKKLVESAVKNARVFVF
ncbi:MAG: tRNA 4-thiouridine(8) synthase ThiI [Candidatus Diapherotrites archaeon]|nr:tRNA 4-thiouridine(8) synthase ThiI [Candidatus Diapherotrites archaeon]